MSLGGLVSNMVMLTGWFDRDAAVPRAYRLLMASSLGGALFLAVGFGIEQLGWRQTVLTGVGVGSMMLGSVWFLLQDGRRVMPASIP